MPCHTIRQTPVVFENVAYKPAHLALMVAALKEVGFEVQNEAGRELRLWPAGSSPAVENTILYRGGKFEVPSTLRGRFNLGRLKEAYARQAIKLHARRNGWLVRDLSSTGFELVKR